MLEQMGKQAQAAEAVLALTTTEQRNEAIRAIAAALLAAKAVPDSLKTLIDAGAEKVGLITE